VQGVIKAYDPSSGGGTIIADSDLAEYELAADALEHSVFRMLRQGQRVVFDLDPRGLATRLRLGSEVDMGTPGFEVGHPDDPQHPQEGPDQRPLPERS
jgi:cold shock CspA family protein